jgi:hypothetical protein
MVKDVKASKVLGQWQKMAKAFGAKINTSIH